MNATLLASQAQLAPVALGSHTPCYDKHSQELDYHDDAPAAMDSQECRSWDEYFRQQGDVSGVQIADSVDEEHRLLLGPTMTSTVSEEAVLLREEETPTVDMRQFLSGLETSCPRSNTCASWWPHWRPLNRRKRNCPRHPRQAYPPHRLQSTPWSRPC